MRRPRASIPRRGYRRLVMWPMRSLDPCGLPAERPFQHTTALGVRTVASLAPVCRAIDWQAWDHPRQAPRETLQPSAHPRGYPADHQGPAPLPGRCRSRAGEVSALSGRDYLTRLKQVVAMAAPRVDVFDPTVGAAVAFTPAVLVPLTTEWTWKFEYHAASAARGFRFERHVDAPTVIHNPILRS